MSVVAAIDHTTSQVDDNQVILRINHCVHGLQVGVDDIIGMQVGDGTHEL